MSCPSWRHLLLGECVTFFEVRNLLSVKSPLSFWIIAGEWIYFWAGKISALSFSSFAFDLAMLSNRVMLLSWRCCLLLSPCDEWQYFVFLWWVLWLLSSDGRICRKVSLSSLSLFFFTYQRDLGHRWDRWRWRMSWSLPGNGWWKTPIGGWIGVIANLITFKTNMDEWCNDLSKQD